MKIQASSPLFFFQRNREYKKMRLQLKGKKPSKFFKAADEIDEIDRSAYISASHPRPWKGLGPFRGEGLQFVQIAFDQQ